MEELEDTQEPPEGEKLEEDKPEEDKLGEVHMQEAVPQGEVQSNNPNKEDNQ